MSKYLILIPLLYAAAASAQDITAYKYGNRLFDITCGSDGAEILLGHQSLYKHGAALQQSSSINLITLLKAEYTNSFVAFYPSPIASTVHSDLNLLTEPQKLPSDFYTQHLGFFCQQELNMTRKNIPIHFRLGNMEQVNYLERKPGYLYDPKNK